MLTRMTRMARMLTRMTRWLAGSHIIHTPLKRTKLILQPGMHYMLAHHIVVQHKLIEHCAQRFVSNTHFSKLFTSPLMSLLVLLRPYWSFNILTSPFPSLLVLLCPY